MLADLIWCLLLLPGSLQWGFKGASSERSWQSNSPSHSQFFCFRHWPLAQRKSLGPHVGYSVTERTSFVQIHPKYTVYKDYTHTETHLPHSGDSSDPSRQSKSWSHTKCLGIHCLFWHWNSASSQVVLVAEKRNEEARNKTTSTNTSS